MSVIIASSEINPLVPQPAEIVLALIAFGILFWFLWKIVAPKFEELYQERTAAIEGGLTKAEATQREAAAALERYQSQLGEARAEASRIREEAREQGASILAEMRDQAQAESARIVAAAHTQIEAERAAAVTALRAEVGSLAVTLAGKIVGAQMADAAAQSSVIDRFLDELEDQEQPV